MDLSEGDTDSHAPKPSVNSKIYRPLTFHTGTTLKPVSLASRNNNLKEKLPIQIIAARVVNTTPFACIGAPTPEEAGYETTKISGDYYEHTKTRTAIIVLSGATANHLDDLDNSVNVIESLIKDPRLVPGPGATELALNKCIEANRSGMRKLVQHAVKRTLAENALGDAKGNEVLTRLWAKHEQKGSEIWGVEIATDFKILDLLATKPWAINPATKAAISVLSVDIIITSKPVGHSPSTSK
ncbi:TCP-1/cpn60 chaperonin family-domain-containing protein [Suillus subaureus]|uniref:TCP-1/cpn60 chaperonin family-domain-containing protein n=1 Tax=Suillus subaureus TaxID=48587 RepID=A0A9P7JGF9_9AGAM|nr:TCP-1/cpn60 chaperonin family-domain-containing protein [Suillus subaureus]KAG1821751.1 TCP-1/cpn60 chaperonin family-domain-containing protein [Suillus subaureus]